MACAGEKFIYNFYNAGIASISPFIYSVSVLSCSCYKNFLVDISFLCDKSAVIGETIKRTFCMGMFKGV